MIGAETRGFDTAKVEQFKKIIGTAPVIGSEKWQDEFIKYCIKILTLRNVIGSYRAMRIYFADAFCLATVTILDDETVQNVVDYLSRERITTWVSSEGTHVLTIKGKALAKQLIDKSTDDVPTQIIKKKITLFHRLRIMPLPYRTPKVSARSKRNSAK
ncbi:hypothetical protein FACS1894170_12030 [Planctomycetales bacterium]|nr:hypothetical protein FACS1894170_12030 [Planctomycetales bacterium]